MRPSQIISLEEGKKEDFKDVLFLKYFIRDYAKYLGLDGEEMVDEFNEFLFDFTSKIPLEEIEKAKLNNVNKKEVVSPYTSEVSNKKGTKVVMIPNTPTEQSDIIKENYLRSACDEYQKRLSRYFDI